MDGGRRGVVVTGADGFVGRALRAHWVATGRPFRAAVRRRGSGAALPPGCVTIDDLALAADAQLDALVADATAIVHLAGRAHVMRESATDPAAAYRAANVATTAALARAAVRAGVGVSFSRAASRSTARPAHPGIRSARPTCRRRPMPMLRRSGRPNGNSPPSRPARRWCRWRCACRWSTAPGWAPISWRCWTPWPAGACCRWAPCARGAACSSSAIWSPPSTRRSTWCRRPRACTASPMRRRSRCPISCARSPSRWTCRRDCCRCRCRCCALPAGSPGARRRSSASPPRSKWTAAGFAGRPAGRRRRRWKQGLAATARWWRSRHSL